MDLNIYTFLIFFLYYTISSAIFKIVSFAISEYRLKKQQKEAHKLFEELLSSGAMKLVSLDGGVQDDDGGQTWN